MSERTIIIGDVHGCDRELAGLLKEVGADPRHDTILFIGDLINKGPSSRGVWELYREMQGKAILGNHELSMLELVKGRIHKHGKYYSQLQHDFGRYFTDFVLDVSQWPLWYEDRNLMLVHAGLVPGLHPDQCDPWHLVTIRTWDGTGEDLKDPANPPWFDFYAGEDLVVFGHWAALGGLDRPRVIGLDTGCVYGGKLSCLILPERRIVSVSAKKAYAAIN